MNPLTNMKNVKKLSEQELYTTNKTSWHDQYRESAWVFVGGLPYDLTEGDIICVFSQYGEIVNVNLVRDKDSGKSKGFCFICYEDQRSTDLAVDNLNGIKIMNRTIRVDHVSDYKVPKEFKNADTETKRLHEEGCAPKVSSKPALVKQEIVDSNIRETLRDQIVDGVRLPMRLPIYNSGNAAGQVKEEVEEIKVKKEKQKKSKKKKDKKADSSPHSSSNSSDVEHKKRKSKSRQEKEHKKHKK